MNKILIDNKNVLEITEDTILELTEKVSYDLSFILKEGTLTLNMLNEESNNNIKFEMNENTKVDFNYFTKNTNDEITVNLNGEKAEFNLNYSTISTKENDYKIKITHNASKTVSNIINHGFNNAKFLKFDIEGKVIKEADECVCNQDNKIINLSDELCNIKPKLLIDNYNVIANHSAYIGKFNKDAIFYLNSRGLTTKEAYNLLLQGFLYGKMNFREELKNKIIKEIYNLEVK